MNKSLGFNGAVVFGNNHNVSNVALALACTVNALKILITVGSNVGEFNALAYHLTCESENFLLASGHIKCNKSLNCSKRLGEGSDYVVRGVGCIAYKLNIANGFRGISNQSIEEGVCLLLCGRNVAVNSVTGLPGQLLHVLNLTVIANVNKCLGLNGTIIFRDNENVSNVTVAALVTINTLCVIHALGGHVFKLCTITNHRSCERFNLLLGSGKVELNKLVYSIKCLGEGSNYVVRSISSVGYKLNLTDCIGGAANQSVVEGVCLLLCGRNVAVNSVTGLPGQLVDVLNFSVCSDMNKSLGFNGAVVLGNNENVCNVALAALRTINALCVGHILGSNVFKLCALYKLACESEKLLVGSGESFFLFLAIVTALACVGGESLESIGYGIFNMI